MIRRAAGAFSTVLLCMLAAPALAEPAVQFVIGDTGDCAVDGTARVAAALSAQPDADRGTLVEVGDLAYPVSTRARLDECHEPHWGRFKKRLAVPGNHDWPEVGGGFFSLFPEPVPRKVALGGAWHMLLLNSNLRKDDWQAQLGWLDGALAQSRNECLIAVWHHPRWSSGKHGDNAFVQPLWEKLQGKASFTLHGHDHHFEALPPLDAAGKPAVAGLASFIAGNGGAPLYPPGYKAHSQRALYGTWGFLRIELDGRRYRWQAFGIDGKVKDADQGECRVTAAGG